jgi:aryl-alcohol dehydrogenase-like predicted oxidoreductase
VRFVLDHPHVSSALIGFGEAWQIDGALAALDVQAAPVDWARIVAETRNPPRGA